MTDDDQEEQHYSRLVGDIMDRFLERAYFTTMATVSLRALFPVWDEPYDQICRTTLRMMLDDLAESFALRDVMQLSLIHIPSPRDLH